MIIKVNPGRRKEIAVNDLLAEKMEMLNLFIADSRELLDDAEPQIIVIEKSALNSGKIDQEALNAVFRLFHSVKGSASFLELHNVIRVTHEAETLLDILRQGEVTIKPGHVDLLIGAVDLVRNILDVVEERQSDTGFEDSAEKISNELTRTINSLSCRNQVDTEKGENNVLPAPEETELMNSPINEANEIPAEKDSEDILNSDEILEHFIEEANELLDEAENVLLQLEGLPDDLELANNCFRFIHSFKGNAGFLGFEPLEKVSFHVENILGEIREGRQACSSITISFLLYAVDALRNAVALINDGKDPEIPGIDELVKRLEKLIVPAAEKPVETASVQPVNKPEEYTESKKEQSLQTITQPETEKKAPAAENGKENAAPEKQPQQAQQQAIRVDVDKLDTLLDLIGELVIAEAMVVNNQTLRDLQMEGIEKTVTQLDKITREIQEVSMSMRMIPLGGTFRKMVRLVRDLANKGNKKVNLEIIGEETEVDKTIIEHISDPLVHLIRNAMDHGIEKPEERKAVGKPETGRLTIEAKHSLGEVWIVIEDDGKGLNREKILQKGVERGLVHSGDTDLKDEEIWKLIFEPGFSTAEQVSDISGRGVGMDVVKKNIEKLRGRVEVRSKAGKGTMFVVRIPLTLAIIEGMVVKVGQNRYIIPIVSIKESFQAGADQITYTPDKLEIVSVRGELLPVLRLHELYDIEPLHQELSDGILMIVASDENKCCLFVDELIGQQQIVIKGLPAYLGYAKGISGCAILSDGDISMILDIEDLIISVENK
ncbi:MAG TPA: chemotaxis protein CheA [Desulfotomaculum sp.]|nr:MAG: CheA signal transduction histidine kinase [Desulfotomaculum sp. 46_80]HAG10984.1 chemotaxis protein CheA [Desulfotomaculum sp.]HBY04859.1 chemotaxis protein CheA [Desulfotomaculum sp.]